MSDLPTPEDIEIMAIRAGLSIKETCRRAGISPSVFQRWKCDLASPRLRSVAAMQTVLKRAIADRKAQE